jgi:hypothetical protein
MSPDLLINVKTSNMSPDLLPDLKPEIQLHFHQTKFSLPFIWQSVIIFQKLS